MSVMKEFSRLFQNLQGLQTCFVRDRVILFYYVTCAINYGKTRQIYAGLQGA